MNFTKHQLRSLLFIFSLCISLPGETASNGELENEIKDLKEKVKEIDSLKQEIKTLRKKSRHRHSKLKNNFTEWKDRLDMNGYATASLAKASESFGVADGISNRAWNTQSDSFLGLQIDFAIQEKLNYSIQLTSLPLDSENHVRTEWSYLTYDYNNRWQFRAGRLRIPYYMLSESVEVGYSYNWVRPPRGFYAIQANNAELLDINYQRTFGVTNLNWRLYFGGYKTTQDLSEDLEVDFLVQDMVGSVINIHKGDITGTFGLIYIPKITNSISGSEEAFDITSLAGASEALLQLTRQTISTTPELAAIEAAISAAETGGLPFSLANPQQEVVSDDPSAAIDAFARLSRDRHMQHKEEESYYANIGVQYDNGHLQILSEFARSDLRDTILNVYESGYLMASYRFHQKWVPFISYAKIRSITGHRTRPVQADFHQYIASAYTEKYGDPAIGAAIAGISSTNLDIILKTFRTKVESTSIGLRYDVLPGIALKAQIDFNRTKDNFTSPFGLGAFNAETNDFNPNKVKVLSFALDTVF